MINKLKAVFSFAQNFLYPKPEKCCFCNNLADHNYFCQRCWQEISKPKKQEFCRKCGRIIAQLTPQFCSECAGVINEFSFARAAGEYWGIYREILHQYKYVGRQSLARPMGMLMADVVLSDRRFQGVEQILPIPLSATKYAQRKFNQSQLLAQEVGRVLRLPVQARLLKRVRDTRVQAKLSKQERRANLAGAFAVDSDSAKELKGKRLLLIDDVFTTGSTIAEATKTLLEAGAGEVAVLTWATGLVRLSNQERGCADELKELC